MPLSNKCHRSFSEERQTCPQNRSESFRHRQVCFAIWSGFRPVLQLLDFVAPPRLPTYMDLSRESTSVFTRQLCGRSVFSGARSTHRLLETEFPAGSVHQLTLASLLKQGWCYQTHNAWQVERIVTCRFKVLVSRTNPRLKTTEFSSEGEAITREVKNKLELSDWTLAIGTGSLFQGTILHI